jgi:hypothetical protein
MDAMKPQLNLVQPQSSNLSGDHITMSVNNFKPRKFEDHTLVDNDGKIVGHVRVKPSGILWAPSNSKVWYGISIETFASWMEEYGKRQKK